MDRLDAYIPIDRRIALAQGGRLPDRARGAALFADVSGFTPLTEALAGELGPQRGAEELTQHLNRIYGALIDEAHRYGGSVISFSGDALTCWFEEKDDASSLRAIACALAMQQVTAQSATLRTPAGSEFRISIKVAVTSGAARRFIAGQPRVQTIDVLAGAIMDRLAAVEHQAQPGEVVVSAEALEPIADRVAVREWRATPGGDRVAVVGGLSQPVPPAPWPSDAPVDDAVARPWLLPPVYDRLRGGQAQFLAELRPVVALFLAFGGIDYDDDKAGEKLDAFICWVQEITARFDGSLLQLTMGDKGSYLNVAFGAPTAHEDDSIRAVNAALELRTPPAKLGFIRDIRIGLSRGQMRTGEHGGPTRRTYSALGNEVNVAARLVTQARPGQILATPRVAEAVGGMFDLEEIEPLTLKGMAKPLSVHAVRGRRREPVRGHRQRPAAPLVGRESERALLTAQLHALRDGRGGIVIVEGEAGIGKSRLVEYLDQQARDLGLTSLIGEGDAIERSTAYHAWRSIFGQLFHLESIEEAGVETREAWRARILARLEAVDPDLVRLAPLLNAVLPLDFQDNDLTVHMTGEVRANNTHELLTGLLGAEARSAPVLLIVEDAHWLDSASWALLRLVSRTVQPALLVIATRPLSDPLPGEYSALRGAADTRHLRLETLSPAEINALVGQRLGVDRLPQPVVDFIHQKAEGHPFFSEELAYALRDAGLIQIVDGECRLAPGARDLRALDFPDTIQGVITSRIDRLAPEQQLTLKVASVIGRLFAFRVLRDVHPVEADRLRLIEYLDGLHRLDITPLETPEPDLAYLFKHIITQEVAYNLMTFSQRRQLHRVVAEWHEKTHADDRTTYYTLLAHHWRQTIDDPQRDAELALKAIEYLEKAGQQALHGNANQEAIYFLSEALTLDAQLDPGERSLQRARLHRQRGEAYNRLGQTPSSRADFEKALACLGKPAPASSGQVTGSLLRQAGGQMAHRLRPARYLGRAQGEAEAIALEAARAHAALTVIYYVAGETSGFMNSTLSALNLAEIAQPSATLAESYATLCVIMGILGRFKWAESYARLALEAAHRLNTPSVLGSVLVRIGVYRTGIGQWAKARRDVEQAIEHYRRINDHRGWGDSVNVLIRLLYLHGQYAESRTFCDALIASSRKIENVQHESWGHTVAATNLLQQAQLEEAIDSLTRAVAVHGKSITDSEKYSADSVMALARLRSGDWQPALELAGPALDWVLSTSPSIFATQNAYFARADVYLAAWEKSQRNELSGSSVDARSLGESAGKACKEMHKFAKVFPIGRPAAWLCEGLYQSLSGNPAKARQAWQKGLTYAEQLDMPYERGRVHLEIGRHLPPNDPARQEHLRRAHDLFAGLGTGYELAQAQAALEE